MTGLSVVSQTLCKIEVFPAFALPMMSTLNRVPGMRGRWRPGGVGAGIGGRRVERGLVLCVGLMARKGRVVRKTG